MGKYFFLFFLKSLEDEHRCRFYSKNFIFPIFFSECPLFIFYLVAKKIESTLVSSKEKEKREVIQLQRKSFH
jgi:hypothetical protein